MSIKQNFRTTMKKVNGDLLTPILIFNRLQGTRKFLLESSSKSEDIGRYSFIGVNPRKTYSGLDTTLTEHSHLTNKTYHYEGDLLHSLKQVMPRISNHTEYPFTGGAIGYIRGLEQTEGEQSIPSVQFHIYDTLVIFDHVTDELAVFHTNIEAEQTVPNIDEIITQLFTATPIVETDYSLSPFSTHAQSEGFSQTYVADFSGVAFALYRKLRVENSSPYMYYIEFDDQILIGASPESLVHVRDGIVTTNATTTANDLQKICVANSVGETTAQTVGKLSPTLHAIDALAHCLPATGTLGYIGFNGQIDFAHTIQTMLLTDHKAYLQTATTQSIRKDAAEQIASQVHAMSSLVKGG